MTKTANPPTTPPAMGPAMDGELEPVLAGVVADVVLVGFWPVVEDVGLTVTKTVDADVSTTVVGFALVTAAPFSIVTL